MNARLAAPGFDAVFSSNTLHIMGWPEVDALFAGLPTSSPAMRGWPFTAPSTMAGNSPERAIAAFDAWLKGQERPPRAYAISRRSTRWRKARLVLLEDRAMPSNNRCIVWAQRRTGRAAGRSTCLIAPANCPTPTGAPRHRRRSVHQPRLPRRRRRNRRRRHRTRLAGAAPGAARRCGPPGRVAAALPARAFLRRFLARMELRRAWRGTGASTT
ncbi:MAG: class I SAM-dependent methyltransferase [Rhodocyclaceae bacterium]|nr:class I SAM-dependent methyltransferase [Rhodocyclaceae bacterium]